MRFPWLLAIGMVASSAAAQDRWWSLEPLVSPDIPPVGSAWERTVVDRFVARRLRRVGLAPASEASRRVLIRRLTFDLHGLPPRPEEVAEFVGDSAPGAYERLVDRLLASPHYGERWARHWLDVVHYGETHGYDKDKLRPHAWPYRDWVIEAFQRDVPYARFVRAQLAGDVFHPDEPDLIRALGFIAAGPWDFVGHTELREGTVDKQITRSLDRDDMLMNAMSTFASTTAHCARCHDHKFDPIPQKDYYHLQAVFAGVERGNRVYQPRASDSLLSSRARTNGYHSVIEKTRDVTKWVQVDLGSVVPIEAVTLFPAHVVYGGHDGPGFGFPVRFRIEASERASFAKPVTIVDQTQQDVENPRGRALRYPARLRARFVRVTATRLWERTADWVFALAELAVESRGRNIATGATVQSLDTIELGQSWSRRFLTDGSARRRGKRVYAVKSIAKPRSIHVLARGDVRRRRESVGAGALSVLPGLAHHFRGARSEGQRRAAFARWLTDPGNPLTWRSIVNRVWQYHFGRGLVDTPNDFGKMGNRPSHPQLLDWLAIRFRDQGGSFKNLHRLLLCSAVYRQRSRVTNSVALAKDADNRLLWRMNRRRLEAEAVRDSMLAVSGRLDRTVGGPSVRWFAFENDHSPRYDYRAFDPDGPGARRRSVYRHIVRSVPDPFFEVLDCADPSQLTPKRYATLTPLQALALLNNPFVLAQSRHFAATISRSTESSEQRIAVAFRLALARAPAPEESRVLVAHAKQHGLASVCRLIFNLNEFVFVD